MDWKECQEKRFVKAVASDHALIRALVSTSKKKIESASRLALDETTAATKTGVVYDAVREILEALAIMNGFKVYNHECFCAFLDEICKEKSLSMAFDRFRKLRNQISYYGKDIAPEDAKIIITDMMALRKTLLLKYFDKIS